MTKQKYILILISIIISVLFLYITFNTFNTKKRVDIIVSRDASFEPENLSKKTQNIVAFSDELLLNFAKEKDLNLKIKIVPYLNQKSEILKKQSNAISTFSNSHIYDYSDPYLDIGSILVVKSNSNINTLNDLEGSIIEVPDSESASIISSNTPNVIIHNYVDSIKSLENLIENKCAATTMCILEASSFQNNIFYGQIKIVPIFLKHTYLRLATQDNKDLIIKFNEYLLEIKNNGEYKALVRKWGIYN